MMDDNKWFVPHKDYTDYCFNIPIHFKAGCKYETYCFKEGYTSVKNGMNYISYGTTKLSLLGQIVIGPNPAQQEKQWFEELDKLEAAGYTEKDALAKLGPCPYG